MNSFYQRQIILPFIGIAGQEKITNAKALIIGAGGLGHPSVSYLAGAGVGTIGILDFDKVDYSNLHRQIFFTPQDVGNLKAEVLAHQISKQNPHIKVNTHLEYLDATNVDTILCQYEIIIDCCDNLKTKFLIHDRCYLLQKILVQGSIDQIEGELKVFNFTNKEANAPCLRCLWETMPEENCINSCVEAGVLPTTAGVFGVLMANEVLKIILDSEHLKNGETYIFNLHSLESRKIKWKKNATCTLCSNNQQHSEVTNSSYEINHNQITKLADYHVIDLRSRFLLPDEINTKTNYLLVCEKGVTSLSHTKILRQEGFLNVWSLSGGARCLSLLK